MSALLTLPFKPENVAPLNSPDGTEPEAVGRFYYAWDTQYDRGLIKVLCVRNMSGISLEPKRLVTFKAGKFGQEVDGYANIHTELCFPIWDRHPSSIADKQLLYVVVEGPTLVKLSRDPAGDQITISEGDWLVNATAVSSQSTTSGRARKHSVPATSTADASEVFGNVNNRIGRALSAKTTADTGADCLVMCHITL